MGKDNSIEIQMPENTGYSVDGGWGTGDGGCLSVKATGIVFR